MSDLRDLDGVVFARGNASKDGVAVALMSASGFVEGHYYPAESLTIDTVEGCQALHAMLGELLEQHEQLRDAAKLPPLPPINL